VSIRKTLLVAFVGVGLISAMLLAGLAFVRARQAVLSEIERSLATQARGVSTGIDKMMFERLQNAATWSRLDIMQDLQVQDVDKRLSQFLADLQTGYSDVYLNLSCLDLQGRVVSSSNASLVGTRITTEVPRVVARVSGASIGLAFPGGPLASTSSEVSMSVPLRAAFREGELGRLRLQLDWARIHEVLDQAAGDEGRMVALLDRDGRMVAASSALRSRGLLMGRALADWRRDDATVQVRAGRPLDDSDVIVGASASRGYARFTGFGWTTLVIQPVDQAFAPIHRMGLIFLGLFGIILVFTVLTATWVSRKIAEPIVALTLYARAYVRRKALGSPPVAGGGEVGELTEAFVSMVRDIAQSQQHLVRASKLAVVGEMSAVIAHEVRTPLGILRSSAQMLRREAHISEQGRELVGFIDSETERLNRLVSAMLDTARPRAASYTEVDIDELVRHAVAMLAGQAEARGVLVSEHFRASDAVIQCDREQITQVLLNILVNGLQILQHGGRIDVSTHDDGDRLRIEIADDGPGIDPAARARVFEAFFFQREGGIGLGLAIVQQIVVSHGGEIVASESGLGGALFCITLPRKQTASP
jgi:two-component system, NtrC family, sensor histidine kinase HydH